MSTGRNSSVENGAQLWKAFEGSKCHGLQTADEIEVFYFLRLLVRNAVRKHSRWKTRVISRQIWLNSRAKLTRRSSSLFHVEQFAAVLVRCHVPRGTCEFHPTELTLRRPMANTRSSLFGIAMLFAHE